MFSTMHVVVPPSVLSELCWFGTSEFHTDVRRSKDACIETRKSEVVIWFVMMPNRIALFMWRIN